MVAGTTIVSRNFVLFELREFSGAAGEYSVPARRKGKDGFRAHIEWQRPGGGTHLACGGRKLSATRWHGEGAGSVARIPGN